MDGLNDRYQNKIQGDLFRSPQLSGCIFCVPQMHLQSFYIFIYSETCSVTGGGHKLTSNLQIAKVENDTLGRETKNHKTEKFNSELNENANGLIDEFHDADVKVLDYISDQAENRLFGIHPN